MLTILLGGSIPLVEFDICADVSAGISAISVEFLIPVSANCFLRPFQSIRSLCGTSSSTSFLYVRLGVMPCPYFVSLLPSIAPFSDAKSAHALIR